MAVEDDTQSATLPAVEVAMATKFNRDHAIHILD